MRILERNQSVNYAMQVAFGYSEAAQTALTGVADSEYKRALQWMPEFVVAREK
jgi:octaprenyl-diphosphate synthase